MRLERWAGAVLAVASVGAYAQTQGSRVVIFVRHGEKVSEAPDALLSAAGERRAQCLAEMLKDTPLREVIATDVKRTQQMAAPAAKEHGIEVRVIPKQNEEGLQRALRAQLGNVLVVNHADMLAKVVQDFTGAALSGSGQIGYDEMLLVPVVDGKTGTAVVMHYCEAVGRE